MSPLLAAILAANLGTHGACYPIMEQDIRQNAGNYQQEALSIQPKPIAYLQKATEYKATYFDPSIVVKKEIEGIAKEGTKINPLEKVSLTYNLLFFNAQDEDELNWALNQDEACMWILISGSPSELEKKYERPVYFDQYGLLMRKFHLKKTPTKISQEGLLLKIEEIPSV